MHGEENEYLINEGPKRGVIFVTLNTAWSEIVFYYELYSRKLTTSSRVPMNPSERNATSELPYIIQIHQN
jgi:hypothetical protein